MTPAPVRPEYRDVPFDELHLDPDNPRFITASDVGDLKTFLPWFENDADLLSVADSISTNGYFAGEPLLVAPSKEDPESLVVVEGNRRLAAVLLLHDPGYLPKSGRLQEMSERTDLEQLKTLPCAVYPERGQILDYLGNRHVIGVRQWEPLAKATYLEQLREEAIRRGEPHDDRTLARRIGSKADYVRRLLNSLEAFRRVEERGVATRDEGRFSILQTALQYAPIARYVGIDLRNEPDPDKIDDDALDHLARWTLVPQPTERGRPAPKVNSRRLADLSKIVDSEVARNEFIEGASIDRALRLTDASSEALLEALQEATTAVAAARSQAKQLEGAPDETARAALADLEEAVGLLGTEMRPSEDGANAP
jgi:hypothetical protein